MNSVWLVADPHFSHTGMVKFLREDGITKVRPWDTIEEMDEALIANWNSVVGVHDKIYVLGDVVINVKALAKIMPRLNGKKVLIKGNHDIFGLEYYTPHFYDIRAYHKLERMVLSHIPIHPMNLTRFKVNVHGHLHHYVVELSPHHPDPRYKSVCVEKIDYTPIELSVVQQHFASL